MTISQIVKARNVSHSTATRRMRGVKPKRIIKQIGPKGDAHNVADYAKGDVAKAFAEANKALKRANQIVAKAVERINKAKKGIAPKAAKKKGAKK